MEQLRRRRKLAAWTAAAGVYVWFAAVHNADRIKARKAARRQERRARLTR